MEDEFDQLMSLFSQDSIKKEANMVEIFQRCTEFFDKYQYVLSQGSNDERIAMQKKMNALRDKLKEENEKAQSVIGISPDDVKALLSDEKNFTPEQWEFLQNAQEKLFQAKEEVEKEEQQDREKREALLKSKSKKKPTTRKSGWMKTWNRLMKF